MRREMGDEQYAFLTTITVEDSLCQSLRLGGVARETSLDREIDRAATMKDSAKSKHKRLAIMLISAAGHIIMYWIDR